ncbi:hypothetical protein NL676_003539 [Syzygium grande]|nr:hypothetical protein NL676_003539 [Syzygium grande]
MHHRRSTSESGERFRDSLSSETHPPPPPLAGPIQIQKKSLITSGEPNRVKRAPSASDRACRLDPFETRVHRPCPCPWPPSLSISRSLGRGARDSNLSAGDVAQQ